MSAGNIIFFFLVLLCAIYLKLLLGYDDGFIYIFLHKSQKKKRGEHKMREDTKAHSKTLHEKVLQLAPVGFVAVDTFHTKGLTQNRTHEKSIASTSISIL